MEIKKIAMVGLGTMGNQIAMQCALCGYEVHGYSRRFPGPKNCRRNAENQ